MQCFDVGMFAQPDLSSKLEVSYRYRPYNDPGELISKPGAAEQMYRVPRKYLSYLPGPNQPNAHSRQSAICISCQSSFLASSRDPLEQPSDIFPSVGTLSI